MMTLDEVRVALIDKRISVVADRVGIPNSTIYAVRDGRASNPTYAVLKALSDYLSNAQEG